MFSRLASIHVEKWYTTTKYLNPFSPLGTCQSFWILFIKLFLKKLIIKFEFIKKKIQIKYIKIFR